MITDEMVKAMAMSLAVGRGRAAAGPREIKDAERALTAVLPMIRAEVLEEAEKVAAYVSQRAYLKIHDRKIAEGAAVMSLEIFQAIRAMKGGKP
jgi:hypothetical protein